MKALRLAAVIGLLASAVQNNALAQNTKGTETEVTTRTNPGGFVGLSIGRKGNDTSADK